MRVCLMIEGQEDVTWQQWLEIAALCEELGFDALFRSDHYASVIDGREERGTLDAWTTIAGLAARTTTLRLGTLVSPASFRHPSVLAKSVVTADHISGGRVELGLGTGWSAVEHERYGFPLLALKDRVDVLEEQVEIVVRQWEDGPFSFDGRHYTIRDLDARPKPVQRPRPPLIVGGAAGPRVARIAARWADEYNTFWVGPDEFARRRDVVAGACRDAGRDPADLPFTLMTGFVAGRDREELHRRTLEIARVRGHAPASPEAYIAEHAEAWLIGTPEEIVARLREYEAFGLERLTLQHWAHEDLDAIRLLGEEVIPALG